jgi:hypothetical protein
MEQDFEQTWRSLLQHRYAEPINSEVVRQQRTLNSNRHPLFRPHQRSVRCIPTKQCSEMIALPSPILIDHWMQSE